MLTTWFAKVVAVGSPPRSWLHGLSSSLSFQKQAWFPSCWVDLESNQKAVGYYHDICANTAPSGLLCPMLVIVVVHGHHSRVGLLVAFFLWQCAQNLLVSWKSQGGDFQLTSLFIWLIYKMAEHSTTPLICTNVIHQKDVGTAVLKRMSR